MSRVIESNRSRWARPATLIAILAASGILHAAGALGAAGGSTNPVQDLAPVLAGVRDQSKVPAVAGAVVRDGRIIAVGAVGLRSSAETSPVTVDDRFLIGSCAKAMLRVLVARLADQGILSFDTKLGAALPDVAMRPEYRDVTIEQVLAFRGGIQPYTQIGPQMTPWLFQLEGSRMEQRKAFAAHVLNEEPVAPPGTKEVYSNAGYGIVADVAEKLAGKPWEDLVAEQVFRPLGMSSAIIGLPISPDHPDAPSGHFHNEDSYSPAPGRRPLAPIAPAGMVSCSISDFARFVGELALVQRGQGGPFLSDATSMKIESLTPDGASSEGVAFLGGEGTFTAAFATWPSLGLGIVVETNGGDSDDVCTSAIEAIRAAAAPDAPAHVELVRPPRQGALGIRVETVNGELRVKDVAPGSRADRAGLEPEDVLLSANGKAIGYMNPDQRMVALGRNPLTLSIRRGGRTIALSVPDH